MPQQDAISNCGPDLPSNGVDRFPFFRSQLELGGSNIVFQMRERRRPGDGQHDGRSSQKPGQRNLINIDSFQAEPLQTSFDSLFEMFGSAIWYPLAGSRPCETAFCRDDESLRIRMERFGYEQFARVRPIRIGCVDQIDTQPGCACENFERVLSIRWPTPNTFPGDTHGAKAQPIDRQVAAQFKSRVHSNCWCS